MLEWGERMGGIVRRFLGWSRRRSRAGRDQLALADGELLAVVEQVEGYPTMGGKKGAANLIHGQAALIGAGSYLEVRVELLRQCGRELSSRRPATQPPPPFELPVATAVHDVWGSDLVDITAWGQKFHVCVYQDVVSQKRLCLEPAAGTATSDFVAACFDKACRETGGQTPRVCTKTDRGSQYIAATFREVLAGKCEHVLIPPASPWYNGETERGQRDNRDLLYKYLHRMKRPKAGGELDAMRLACRQARLDLNERISRPSLGNVTPEEVVRGETVEVQQRNREYVARARAERKQRQPGKRTRWKERIADLVDFASWETSRILRFLRLARRDHRAVAG